MPPSIRRADSVAIPAVLLCAASLLSISARTAHAQSHDYHALFDGESFAGWEGSSDLFRVENGSIVAGRLDESIPENAFLCTTREYSDFELKLDVKIDGPGDNGGIQFRSRRLPAHFEVSGYQADAGTVGSEWFNSVIGIEGPVAPDARSPVWGSLYDESRRNRYLAWGMPDDVNRLLNDGWNELTVRAEGPRIRILLNGQQTVDYLEKAHVPQAGNICLQVHSGAPTEIAHRNIRIKELPGSYVAFERTRLDDFFYGEGANFGDLNGDGIHDLVSGPYWYEGPDFSIRHEYYKPKAYDPAHYSDNFFAHVLDFNGDSRNDILIIGFPGQTATWFENPGPPYLDIPVPPARHDGVWPLPMDDAPAPATKDTTRYWAAHVVFDIVDNESPWWTDLTGDGKPEIVAINNGRYGYIEPDWTAPEKPWPFTPISPENGWQRFTHGLGVGDINNDGRMDLIERAGWWEQPASLRGNPIWSFHEVPFSERGGSQMYAYDFDGDGDNDVLTGLAAHGYGFVLYENLVIDSGRSDKEGRANGARRSTDSGSMVSAAPISFRKQVIIGETAEDNPYGVVFAEIHAVDLADMDGDGVLDVVTGKRWWSHGVEGDPDINPRAVLYWLQTVRTDGGVEFVPHLIDDDSGVGVQIVAGDINGDSLPDVIVGNKKGTTLLTQVRD
ncbi:MAG: DUF1080 domain-containing protein [Bacteroidetes bacterium]|nr:DUF1080 domain-containing protein [Bacteroidota bacterium]